MATQKRKTSLQNALRGCFAKKGAAELKSDLEGLFDTLSDYELVDAVIGRVQRCAVEASGKTVDRDFGRMESYEVDEIKKGIRDELVHFVLYLRCTSGVYRPLSCAGDIYFCCGLGVDEGRRDDKSVGTRGRDRYKSTSRNVDSSVGVSEAGFGSVA